MEVGFDEGGEGSCARVGSLLSLRGVCARVRAGDHTVPRVSSIAGHILLPRVGERSMLRALLLSFCVKRATPQASESESTRALSFSRALRVRRHNCARHVPQPHVGTVVRLVRPLDLAELERVLLPIGQLAWALELSHL
eukprot:2612312-Pleurochrysis_carterae.AAC.2